jgi:CRISPR/Cas system-associated exonuclease Cas4 (RecB family)
MNYKLSPSELTFLFNGCKRCFYFKVKENIAQPSIPLPSIFSKIAGLLKTHYHEKRTELLHSSLPPGTVRFGEKWVQSQPISIPSHSDTCYIKGRFDVVVAFDDGTFGVIDYKTGNPEGESTSLYGHQLHSYAYALENPSPGAMRLSPISKLALLYFRPTEVSQNREGWLSFDSQIVPIEVARNDSEYLTFIGDVLTILESPTPPAAEPDCAWCAYVTRLGGTHPQG